MAQGRKDGGKAGGAHGAGEVGRDVDREGAGGAAGMDAPSPLSPHGSAVPHLGRQPDDDDGDLDAEELEIIKRALKLLPLATFAQDLARGADRDWRAGVLTGLVAQAVLEIEAALPGYREPEVTAWAWRVIGNAETRAPEAIGILIAGELLADQKF